MAEPLSSSSAAIFGGIGTTAVVALLYKWFGADATLVVTVVAGSALGVSGGCLFSPGDGRAILQKGAFALAAGLFSSLWVWPGFSETPPALVSAVVSFVAVEPKSNVNAIFSFFGRIRGKGGTQ